MRNRKLGSSTRYRQNHSKQTSRWRTLDTSKKWYLIYNDKVSFKQARAVK